MAGQAYIAASPEVPYIAAVAEVAAQPEKYKRQQQTHVVTLTDPYANRYARTTAVTIIGSGVTVKVNDAAVTPVNGVYNIGSALTFVVEMSADSTYATTKPASVVVSATTTFTVAVDTFAVYLYRLDTGEKVATLTQVATDDGQISVHDKNNGKLKIVFSEALTSRLPVVRGDRADYYYGKPTHRLVIDASTVNNGDFMATIDKVYVR